LLEAIERAAHIGTQGAPVKRCATVATGAILSIDDMAKSNYCLSIWFASKIDSGHIGDREMRPVLTCTFAVLAVLVLLFGMRACADAPADKPAATDA